jgi:hypothetical protein
MDARAVQILPLNRQDFAVLRESRDPCPELDGVRRSDALDAVFPGEYGAASRRIDDVGLVVSPPRERANDGLHPKPSDVDPDLENQNFFVFDVKDGSHFQTVGKLFRAHPTLDFVRAHVGDAQLA